MIVQTPSTVITTLSGPVCIWNPLKSMCSPFREISWSCNSHRRRAQRIFRLTRWGNGGSFVSNIFCRCFRYSDVSDLLMTTPYELKQIPFRLLFFPILIYSVQWYKLAHQIELECQMFHYCTSKIRGWNNREYVNGKCQVSLTLQPFIPHLWRQFCIEFWYPSLHAHSHFPPHDN